MKRGRILTDNASGSITIKWDGTRFALVQRKRIDSSYGFNHTTGYAAIILNPREMLELVKFVGNLGGK